MLWVIAAGAAGGEAPQTADDTDVTGASLETARDASRQTADEEPIVIRADRAWEGDVGEVLHLQGNFVMFTSQWRVDGDRAEVHGPIEDPERILLFGNPAHVWSKNDAGEETTGHSGRIVVRYTDEIVELYEDAQLTAPDASMASSQIIYDLKNKRLKSTGNDGIELVLQRKGGARTSSAAQPESTRSAPGADTPSASPPLPARTDAPARAATQQPRAPGDGTEIGVEAATDTTDD